MTKTKDLVLGIDTSNYTTSVALTDGDQKVIEDRRILLRVKQGERGLRQSNALFQHQENLPPMLKPLLQQYRCRIGGIAVSSRPRPVEGSYMPVFLAGCQTGQLLSDALYVPYMEFSHQEGHLKAASFESDLGREEPYLAWHLSGGTCELLKVQPRNDHSAESTITILGGSLDISFGQLLDRLGVAMGLTFPCGKELDRMALSMEDIAPSKDLFRPISRKGLQFNLSGLETQVLRLSSDGSVSREILVKQLFEEIARCLFCVTSQAAEEEGISRVLFTGGVSASLFLRNRWNTLAGQEKAVHAVFGDPKYSPDNSVGISLLGGEALWH